MDNENTKFYRRVLSGFAWQGISKLLVQAISWVTTIVVARLLMPSDYGLMAIANVFLWIMLAVMDMGLAQALVQKSTVTEEEEDSVFWLGVLLGGILFLALFAAAPMIGSFYKMPGLVAILRVTAVGILITSLKAVPQAMIMRRLDFRSRALVELVASLVSAATVLTLALLDFGVWSLVWGLLLHQTVVTAGFLAVMRRFPRPTLQVRAIAPILRYGLHIMGSNFAFVVSSRADVFVIGKFLGEQATGFYSLAFQLATVPLDKIGTVFNHVAFPSFSRVKDDERRCRTLFVELHRYLLFIAYPLLIGLAVVAKDLVLMLLGTKWLQAVPVLQALCAVNVVRVSGMLISPVLNSRGRHRETLRYSVAGAILLPIAFLAGVQFGLDGVAVAWIVVYPLLYAMLLRYLSSDLAITLADLVRDSRPTLTATAVMAAAAAATQMMGASLHTGVRLGISIGVGAVAYAAVFLIFYGEQVMRMRNGLRALRSGSSA